jgi:hypothetical protein
MMLVDWAKRWNIPDEALNELAALSGVRNKPHESPSVSEAAAQQRVRLDAPKHGVALWRNNNGAATAPNGRPVRYGLANDSKKMSETIKSSDLIGITRYTIKPGDIGRTIGIFTSYEMKKPGWKYTATSRERAQLSWIELIITMGGIARFTTGSRDLWDE